MKKYFTGIVLLMLAAGCNNNKKADNNASLPEIKDSIAVQQPASKTDADSILADLTKRVLLTVKNKDYKAFSEFIHPTAGIRFSPYGYVDTAADMFFTKASFYDATVVHKIRKFNWGSYDGSGDLIRLSVAEYFQKFVYDVDFLNAEKTSVNKMLGGGNSLNNLEAVYNNGSYTESYFSGFEEKYGGMDWRALRIAYVKSGDRYFIVAVVHDQWTI